MHQSDDPEETGKIKHLNYLDPTPDYIISISPPGDGDTIPTDALNRRDQLPSFAPSCAVVEVEPGKYEVVTPEAVAPRRQKNGVFIPEGTYHSKPHFVVALLNRQMDTEAYIEAVQAQVAQAADAPNIQTLHDRLSQKRSIGLCGLVEGGSDYLNLIPPSNPDKIQGDLIAQLKGPKSYDPSKLFPKRDKP